MDTTLENDKNLATRDYFLLAIRGWDDKRGDYFPIDDLSTVTQIFSEFLNAEIAYFSKNYKDYEKW